MGLNEHLGDREDVGNAAKQEAACHQHPRPEPLPPGDLVPRCPIPCWADSVVHDGLPIDGLHLDVGGRGVAVLICRDCGVLHVAAADAEEIGRITAATRGG